MSKKVLTVQATHVDDLFLEIFSEVKPIELVSVYAHTANLRCGQSIYSIVSRDNYDAPATACVGDGRLFASLLDLVGTRVSRIGAPTLVFKNGDRLKFDCAVITNSSLPLLCGNIENCASSLRVYSDTISSFPSCPSALASWVANRPHLSEIGCGDIELIDRCHRFINAFSNNTSLDSLPPEEVVEKLIGAGVGLTPAGDDFLCGSISFLMSFDDYLSKSWASFIAQYLSEEMLQSKTTMVSASMLWHASQGRLAAPYRRFLSALIEHSEALRDCVYEIYHIGYSSGLDFSAGAVCMLKRYLSICE